MYTSRRSNDQHYACPLPRSRDSALTTPRNFDTAELLILTIRNSGLYPTFLCCCIAYPGQRKVPVVSLNEAM
jgi:hypothetical protein